MISTPQQFRVLLFQPNRVIDDNNNHYIIDNINYTINIICVLLIKRLRKI